MTRLTLSVAALALSAAACGQKSEPVPASSAATPGTTASEPPSEPALKDSPATPAAPWSAPPIASSSVPRIYVDVWRVAGNRSRCALIAPVSLGAEDSGATPRKATFSGGWAVAYDIPQLRSVFGIAGSGSDAWSPDTYAKWPENIIWSDSSSAGYGPEAGTGPNWLAYVKIPEQQCLYNVWSRRGKSHLEAIIQSLRFVTASD